MPRDATARGQSRTLIAPKRLCADDGWQRIPAADCFCTNVASNVDASEWRTDVQFHRWFGWVRTPRQELLTVLTSERPGFVWKMPVECRKDRCFHGCIQRSKDKDLAATTFGTARDSSFRVPRSDWKIHIFSRNMNSYFEDLCIPSKGCFERFMHLVG
jgi:hypothetical protein